jgi:SAM-dependent methyltransferase
MSIRFPLDGAPELPIQVECNDAEMRELLARTTAAWEKMGREDPYFSVVTSPDYHLEAFEQNQASFWDVGRLEAERMLIWMKRNGVEPEGTCLEYGCGVGRVTCGLEEYFESVIACDISVAHLRLALAVIGSTVRIIHIPNLDALNSLPGFDTLFSLIVLQHNPPPIIAFILDVLLDKLNWGGLAFFQVPTLMRDYTFDLRAYLDNPNSGSCMEMHCLPQRYIFEIARKNGCRPLEVSQDDRTGCECHVSTTFLLVKDLV